MTSRPQSSHLQTSRQCTDADASSSEDDIDHLSPRTMPLAALPSSSPSPAPTHLDLDSAKPTKRASRVNFNDDHSPSRNASPSASRKFITAGTILKRNVPSSRIDNAVGSEDADGEVVHERTAILGAESGNGGLSYNTDDAMQTAIGGEMPKKRKSARSSPRGQMDGTVEGEHDEQQTANTAPALTGWWRKFLDKYGSVELENKGSVARDHLALERTFLAWLRTSLSFASIGIAVTQLFRLNVSINQDQPTGSQLRLRHIGRPLGATFLAVGIITLVIGFRRYFESQHYVIQGKFPASRGSIILIAFCSGALIVASFAVILVIGSVTRDSVSG